MAAAAAAAPRAIFCELRQTQRSAAPPPKLPALEGTPSSSTKIVLQPRVCTLRSYGRDVVIRTRKDADVSPFLASLVDYIENSKKTQDFETLSGRLAMMAFTGTVTVELLTGNSVFRKMDVGAIAEAGGVCLCAVLCAAVFAWFSSNRNRVGRIFTLGCNSFVDSLIDNLVDGLFYDTDPTDWIDDI
ncbi:hypothetical protein QJS10_CPB12g01302 [Acorus calamus]|uniref:Stress enhanced protein 2 n=1 Tax=Acorus calamus TaxID=4465 RepID=A0AAV9DLI1_ACOCL|nr:hypothetical protein QJS10_CPB12g01302 [Acorus calamus]